MSEQGNQEKGLKKDIDQIQCQQEEWDAFGEEEQQEAYDKHEELELEDTDEEESAAIIKEHLMQHNANKEKPAYLVRGAELMCSQGSNKRKMNLSPCHGVYIKVHAVVHELDCIQGEKENITWFGICTPGEDLDTEQIQMVGDDGKEYHGKKCKPHIIGTWLESYDKTRIVDNSKKIEKDPEHPEGCNTLTMDSFLVCKHGGIIMPINSGQDREVSEDEFDYATEDEKKAALDRVKGECSEDIDWEEADCDDLLHARFKEGTSGAVHGTAFENIIKDEEDTFSEPSARDYTDKIVEFIKQKEGFCATPYNGGKTIAYGFDMYLYPDIEINYNSDGTVSEEEGERLLRIILDQSKKQLNDYLDITNQELDQNAYDAAIDLYYNRNSNALTKQVVDAMSARDDEKVWSLLENFDYNYACQYLCEGDEQEAQAYVDRNPGLKVRREEEYAIYQNGF